MPIRKKLFEAYNTIGTEEKKAVNRVLDSGVLSQYLGCWDDDFFGGPEVRKFEKEWAKYFKVKHAIVLNSCTSGLICAIGAIKIKSGDEVIVSPYTMSASAVAPMWYGAKPIFADIDKEYFCIDPKSVEKKITKKTKAIIAVDLFGQPFDADAIRAIAKKHNLKIIEDCAQAPGAKYKNKFAGTLGDVGIFSLNYHKHIHTGEGGVVVTNDDKIAERVQLIRNHAESVVKGKGAIKEFDIIGQNYRLTEIQAAIGREQLKKLSKLNKQRIQNSEYLAKELNKIPGIRTAKVRDNCTHVYYQQPFFYNENEVGMSREKFVKAIRSELPASKLREREGALISAGYIEPLYLLPVFNKKKGLCPVVEKMHKEKLCIHEFMRPSMSRRDLDDVIKAFKKVCKNAKRNILVVCHDAGGAEVVSAYVKKNISEYSFKCVAIGPAEKIFKRKGLSRVMIYKPEANALLNKEDYFQMVLCGTSGESSKLESVFIKKAKSTGIKSIAYLDHWINYKERFGYPSKNWQKNIPDELWVADNYALILAKKLFKKTKIKLVKNLYLKEIKREYNKEKRKFKLKPQNILFMSEPLGTARSSNKLSDEHVILENIFNRVSEDNNAHHLVIAYHPKEKKDKYDALIKKYKNKITIQKQSKSRTKDLVRAKLVIGMKSMALVVALMCGKKVISYLPGKADVCILPFKDIIRIKNISNLPI